MKINVKIYDMSSTILSNDFNFYNLATLLKYDAKLRIKIEDMIFYDDWICPLELLNAINLWTNKLGSNTYETFKYISEDNSINPIFAFKYDNTKNLWEAYSPINNGIRIPNLKLDDIKSFISQYRNSLNKFIE